MRTALPPATPSVCGSTTSRPRRTSSCWTRATRPNSKCGRQIRPPGLPMASSSCAGTAGGSGTTSIRRSLRAAGCRQDSTTPPFPTDGTSYARRFVTEPATNTRATSERTERGWRSRSRCVAPAELTLRKSRRKGRVPSGRFRGCFERQADHLPGRQLSVFEQPRTGGGFRKVASLRASASGRFMHTLTRGTVTDGPGPLRRHAADQAGRKGRGHPRSRSDHHHARAGVSSVTARRSGLEGV